MFYPKSPLDPVTIPHSDGWRVTILPVDAALASRLLENNAGNRKLSNASVARYAAIMRNGGWKTSPEPLIFAPNGRLMNGQTRLNAVKATGITQNFMAVYGVDESVFSVLDRGRVRTLADAHQTEKGESGVARILALIAYSNGAYTSQVLDSDFLRVLAVTRELHADIISVSAARPTFFASVGVRAAVIARLLAGESPAFVLGLYHSLTTSDVANLPPAGAAAVRGVLSGRWKTGAGNNGAFLTLARAWSLFSEKGQNRSTVPVSSYAPAVKEIGEVLRQAVQDNENAK